MSENTLHLSLKETEQYSKLPKVVVMGVGGGGCNAVNNMVDKKIDGVEFIAVNTDIQSLAHSKAQKTIQLGKNTTKGQGAGSFPEVGLSSAEESKEEIEEALNDVQLLFLTAGMGGGTGTGATPYIAKLARERDILTVAVVTKPFQYEAEIRLRLAEQGIAELRKYVDTMIVLPNENLFRIANKETTLKEAFMCSDNVLYLGVRGITDLITTPGLINLDFADVRMVIKKMGRAMMGMGEGEGDNRAIKAVEEALSNPLLEDVNIKGATGALVNITGSPDMTLFEFNEAANRIREEIGGDKAIIKVGTAFMKELEGKVRVSIFATGMQEKDVMDDDFYKHDEREKIDENNTDSELPEDIVENADGILDPGEDCDEDADSDVAIGNRKEKSVFTPTKSVLKGEDSYFDIGVPYVEESIEMDDKKSTSSFFNFFNFSSKKRDKDEDEDEQKPSTFRSKNRKIEFKINSQNGEVDESTLSIPAYLRKRKR